MPRKSNTVEPGIRKYGVKSNYSPETLEEALSNIKNCTLSTNAASKIYKIPRSTLKNKLMNKHGLNVGRPTTLSAEEEEVITNHILSLAECGLPIGLDDVKLVIQSYLNSINRVVKNFKNNLPGWEWGQLFLARQPELKQKFAHNISRSRAKVNEDVVNNFFDKLQVELKDVPPENIYNFDETGFHDDPKKKKLLFRRKCRNADVIRNSTKSCYTVLFCGNAKGELIPPFFIYKGKYTWSDWLTNAPRGSRMTATKSGWIDGDSFDEWFKSQFLPIAKKQEGVKVLIGDNLSSHITINTLRLCKENNVKFICLPPNATHLLQPLDVGYFASLKANWRAILLAWRQTKRGIKAVALPKSYFSQLVTKALERGSDEAAENMIAGFKATGIYPTSREVVLSKLPEYARTTTDDTRDLVGESFKNYLQELRETDLGLNIRKKFQIPVTAGKSVSVEEVETYYENREKQKSTKVKSVAVKRGRPQGSKNIKKQKTAKSADDEKENTSLRQKDIQNNEKGKKIESRTENQKIENNIPSCELVQRKEKELEAVQDQIIELNANVESTDFADLPIENEIEVTSTLETETLEICEEYDVIDGTLQHVSTEINSLSPGTLCTFRSEGSLFPGKVVTYSHPWYTLAVMSKAFEGGWVWPHVRELTKCEPNNIVSVIDAKKMKMKGVGIYEIDDDLLYLEWGA